MEVEDLETTVQATLSAKAPTARDVRDALVDYLGLVGRAFVLKGLQHTDPKADDATVRRLLVVRLALLWKGSRSSWDQPDLKDLVHLRHRIEQWSCARSDPRYARLGRLLDELILAAVVSERLTAKPNQKPRVRLKVIKGGAQVTPPRGRLRLVRGTPG